MASSTSHLNVRYLHTMNTQDVIGLPPLKFSILEKQHKLPYPIDSATRTTEVLALVHTNLCIPMRTPSLDGALCFLFFINDYTRYSHDYFLQKKIALPSHFLQYKAFVEN